MGKGKVYVVKEDKWYDLSNIKLVEDSDGHLILHEKETDYLTVIRYESLSVDYFTALQRVRDVLFMGGTAKI